MDSLRKQNATKRIDHPAIPFRHAALPKHSGRISLNADESVAPVNRKNRSHMKRWRFFGNPKISRRTILRALFVFGFVVLAVMTYLSWKVGGATRSMTIHSPDDSAFSDTVHGAESLLSPIFHRERSALPGENEGRTNVLLLGKANEKSAGQNLTDTIMIASFDFSRKKIALISLPRDLYVEIPGTHSFTKLNALYEMDQKNGDGAKTVERAVSDVTGLPIHAFAALDYDGFVDIVNIVGGVSVYVEKDLFDQKFPGPNYSYETFSIRKGWQDLDGATALKYVRERHSDPEGDFGRAKRQQEILSALKKKAFSFQTLMNPVAISGIINTLGNHIRTDLSFEEILDFVRLVGEFDTKNIATAVFDAWKKDSLLRVSHVPVGPVSMFILLPRTGDWSETRDLAQNVFDLDNMRVKREAIESEDAKIVIVNRSSSPELGSRVARFLGDSLDIKHIRIETETSKENNLETSALLLRGGSEALYTANAITSKLSVRTIVPGDPIASDSSEKYDSSNIVLFLGNDLAKRLSFEEDSPDDLQNAEDDPDYQKRLDTAVASEEK